MTKRSWIVVGAVALVAVASVVTAAAIAGTAPTGTTARATSHPATSHPATSALRSAAPPSAAPRSAPSSGEPTTAGDARVLDFVATLPTVRDVTPDTVGEFTDLVCTTLRSPKMSPSFFGQVLALEEQSYSLTRAQATGLLRTVATSDCPDAVRVVDSAGAQPTAAG